jgi:hypothetical protein
VLFVTKALYLPPHCLLRSAISFVDLKASAVFIFLLEPRINFAFWPAHCVSLLLFFESSSLVLSSVLPLFLLGLILYRADSADLHHFHHSHLLLCLHYFHSVQYE